MKLYAQRNLLPLRNYYLADQNLKIGSNLHIHSIYLASLSVSNSLSLIVCLKLQSFIALFIEMSFI